ncbi:hypothetical protein ONS96_013550 [Cadophora gregata f. sp. sojae]|nr:hypothetical protein ONS96_013550 [Cadophora gregata f. sp. sojae]
MKLTILALPTLALSSQLGAMIFEPMNSLCVVWTVVEKPVHISTCFPSSTVAIFYGCTTTVSSATCIDTTVTESVTLNPRIPAPTGHPVEYTTITTDALTTVCPGPTTFTYGTKTYTVTKATTLTITDCPCTFVRTKHSSEIARTSDFQDSTSSSTAAAGSSSSVLVGVSNSAPVPVPSVSTSPDISSPTIQTPSTIQAPISSSIPVETPTTITTTSSTASLTTTSPPIPSTNTCGASAGGSSCDGSPFGTCCGSDDTCGSDAAHCGTGCQPGYGICSNITIDGSCGNGVFCRIGDCCSRFSFCGSTADYCDVGCQPAWGTCYSL